MILNPINTHILIGCSFILLKRGFKMLDSSKLWDFGLDIPHIATIFVTNPQDIHLHLEGRINLRVISYSDTCVATYVFSTVHCRFALACSRKLSFTQNTIPAWLWSSHCFLTFRGQYESRSLQRTRRIWKQLAKPKEPTLKSYCLIYIVNED